MNLRWRTKGDGVLPAGSQYKNPLELMGSSASDTISESGEENRLPATKVQKTAIAV